MRYRERTSGTTRKSLVAAKRNLGKLGGVSEIRYYIFSSLRTRNNWSYQSNREALMVKGPNGSARFEGLSCGYMGEGPRGLAQILHACGLELDAALKIAYNTERGMMPGDVFRIKFPTPVPISPERIKVW